jgi:hypothetical protein
MLIERQKKIGNRKFYTPEIHRPFIHLRYIEIESKVYRPSKIGKTLNTQ